MANHQHALNRYNALYDNEQYMSLRALVQWELYKNDRAFGAIMGLIIDESIRMAGARGPYYAKAHRRLMAVLCAFPNLKTPVLRYVRRYHKGGNNG